MVDDNQVATCQKRINGLIHCKAFNNILRCELTVNDGRHDLHELDQKKKFQKKKDLESFFQM
jgi:hypothetical protein